MIFRTKLVLQTINWRSFTITEKAATRAVSWLKTPTSAFTLKTLCAMLNRHQPTVSSREMGTQMQR